MIRRIGCLLFALIICFGLVQAECLASSFDPARECSLTVVFAADGVGFADLTVDIYRVAEFHADGTFDLVQPYSAYPVRIHGITSRQEWKDAAQTLVSYITANGVAPTARRKTDSRGSALFAGLQTGIYLVKGLTAYTSDERVVFYDFMVFLPTPQNGGYNYDMEVRPKYTRIPETQRYTVVKLWKDSAAPASRPSSVTVDIFKDGAPYQSVELSSANNWSFSWETYQKGVVWSVAEQNVPAGYEVTVTRDSSVFFVTNSLIPDEPDPPDTPDPPDPPVDPDGPDIPDLPLDPDIPDPPDPPKPDEPEPDVPKTGDTSPLLLYMILLCLSGLGLVIFGTLTLRDIRHGKNK